MLVTMLKDSTGSENGWQVKEFKKDYEYNIHVDLAKVFIDQGWAVFSKDEQERIDRAKALEEKRANKAMDLELENKAAESKKKEAAKKKKEAKGSKLVIPRKPGQKKEEPKKEVE